MYKTLAIEISIILQVLANTLPENKTYAGLVKEKGELFKEINEAIQESIAVLKKNNDTEAVLGIEYMNQLKEQLKEINGTDMPTSKNDANIDTRRRNKVVLNMAEIAAFLHSKSSIKNKQKILLAAENKARVQKELDLWLLQQKLVKDNKVKKMRKVLMKPEDCPRWGRGSKNKKKKVANRRQDGGPGGPTADTQLNCSTSNATTKAAPIVRCYKNAPKDATNGLPRGPRRRRSLHSFISDSPEPYEYSHHSDQSRPTQWRSSHNRSRRDPPYAPPYMSPSGFMTPQANISFYYGPPPSLYLPQSANGYSLAYGSPPRNGAPSPYGASSPYGAQPFYGAPPPYGFPQSYGVPPQYGNPSHYGAPSPYAHSAYEAPQHYGAAAPYGSHSPYGAAPYIHHLASIFSGATGTPLIPSANIPRIANARRAYEAPKVNKATTFNKAAPPATPPVDEPLRLSLLNFDEPTFL